MNFYTSWISLGHAHGFLRTYCLAIMTSTAIFFTSGSGLSLASMVVLSGCSPSSTIKPEPNVTEQIQTPNVDLAAVITAIESQSGSRAVRVILTIQPEDEGVVTSTLRQSGVSVIRRIEGQPLMVTEATPEQLRTLVARGKVQGLSIDKVTPAN